MLVCLPLASRLNTTRLLQIPCNPIAHYVLHLLVTGLPADTDLAFVENERAIAFIKSVPPKPEAALTTVFAGADPVVRVG